MKVALDSFSLPLTTPLSTANGEITERRGFLLRVGEGPTGIGEAAPLPGWTESREECRDTLTDAAAALRNDERATALETASHTPAARHALSLALGDRMARREGCPFSISLASDARNSVPVNATVGDADPHTTADRAAAAVESGIRCVKLKVGVRSLGADVARVRAAREAVSPDVALRADANAAWDRQTARDALSAFADHDVAYVEQPLAADDLRGHADLRGGSVGIALDESLASAPISDAAAAADVLVLKPMALGGPDRVREAAETARAAGATPVVTTTIDAVVARLGALHVAASLGELPPCGLATADLLATDLGSDPAPVTEGRIRVPDAPGIGVAPGEVSTP